MEARSLTDRELQSARILGLVTGYDVDDDARCPEQLRHLVEGSEHENMRPICGADTLWGYGDAVTLQDVITCLKCLERLPLLILRANRRLHLHGVDS